MTRLSLVLLLLLSGCRAVSPTGTQYETPMRDYAKSRVLYYGNLAGIGSPGVWFGLPPQVPDGQTPEASWIGCPGPAVVNWNAYWLENMATLAQVDHGAAHEVAHLFYGFNSGNCVDTSALEAQAEACAFALQAGSACHG